MSEMRKLALLVLTLFAILSTTGITLFTNRIVKPIKQLRDAANELASGDLRELVSVSSKDEILLLANDFNRLIEAMQKVLGGLTQHSVQLASSTEEMSSTLNNFTVQAQNQSASTEEIAATTEQLSAGMDLVYQSSNQQNESVESLIGTMQGLSAKIGDMGKMVVSAGQKIDDINSLAKDGETTLSKLNDSMKAVLESSTSMTSIIEIINEISDRINLLSLNAAIEAA
ncbi:MAG: methyl-accepting chemotaxis protein, partial [Leptonema sp. (in: Bacteria)]|nr:methyl-accepting chemotaxis protein [Leptonema sp. (in: bacteria)]